MRERKGEWIQTYTGKHFYPLDPRPEDFDVLDIAHALAYKCRYSGHCSQFYSVAQHSVLVAAECEKRYPDRPNLAWWGLLHDVGEAYLPDIPRPLKQMDCGVLIECEKNIVKQAAKRFGLIGDEPPEVKQIDTAILATEGILLMGDISDWYLPEPPLDITIVPNNAKLAEWQFHHAWNYFKPEEVK